MSEFRVIDSLRTQEIVHGDARVDVVREEIAVPAAGRDPSIAVERTTPADGPTLPAVVLVHGLAQNRYTWRLSARSFVAALARQGHTVLNVELRGHGASRGLGAGNARRFQEYVRDVVRVVDAAGGSPFVVGHSLGGAVAVGAATERPLRGVIHLAGVYRFATNNRVLRGITRVTRRLAPLLTHASVRVSTGWAGELLARAYQLTDIAGYGLPLAGWVPGSLERDLLEERLVRGFDWTSLDVWVELSRWAAGEPFPYAEAFARTDVPLFVVVGGADPLLEPADARPCFEESGSTDKRFVVLEPFEHRVHWGHIDMILGRHAPEVVWPLLLSWLAERSEAS